MFKLVLEEAQEPEIKLPTSPGSLKKQESSRKNIYFCFIDYAKVFDCVDHHKLWKVLKEMGIPDHLTCLLRNLYAGQEATVRTGHGATDCFQTGKGVHQGCIYIFIGRYGPHQIFFFFSFFLSLGIYCIKYHVLVHFALY